jgi:hypothetical protein
MQMHTKGTSLKGNRSNLPMAVVEADDFIEASSVTSSSTITIARRKPSFSIKGCSKCLARYDKINGYLKNFGVSYLISPSYPKMPTLRGT